MIPKYYNTTHSGKIEILDDTDPNSITIRFAESYNIVNGVSLMDIEYNEVIDTRRYVCKGKASYRNVNRKLSNSILFEKWRYVINHNECHKDFCDFDLFYNVAKDRNGVKTRTLSHSFYDSGIIGLETMEFVSRATSRIINDIRKYTDILGPILDTTKESQVVPRLASRITQELNIGYDDKITARLTFLKDKLLKKMKDDVSSKLLYVFDKDGKFLTRTTATVDKILAHNALGNLVSKYPNSFKEKDTVTYVKHKVLTVYSRGSLHRLLQDNSLNDDKGYVSEVIEFLNNIDPHTTADVKISYSSLVSQEQINKLMRYVTEYNKPGITVSELEYH